MMELEIVSKETIKPLSPTPPELTTLPLCLFDQQAPNMYIQILYFYRTNNVVDPDRARRRRRLKDSLSKALTFYYPFAGRLREGGDIIDCNDMGATFSEAKLQCPMSEFTNTIHSQHESILKSTCLDDMNGKDLPLLSIQLTQFECGGEVMFVACYHKVGDMASLTNFMNDWALIARFSGDGDPPVARPQFNAAKLFPPESDDGGVPSGRKGLGKLENVCTKRLVFEGSKLGALKAMASETVENPSRVQILTALIYKAALSAKKSVTGNLPPTSLLQIINLRTRVEPPLPVISSGNIISFFIASSTTMDQSEMELRNFVGNMKKNFEEYCKKFPKDYRVEEWSLLHKLHQKESLERWRNPKDYILYICTSWCKFPIYDADFGSGKPEWITVPAFSISNMIFLMDAKDGEGVEAIVSLEKEEMAAFEKNEELLLFCELKNFSSTF